jgi:hypothetical protein
MAALADLENHLLKGCRPTPRTCLASRHGGDQSLGNGGVERL